MHLLKMIWTELQFLEILFQIHNIIYSKPWDQYETNKMYIHLCTWLNHKHYLQISIICC